MFGIHIQLTFVFYVYFARKRPAIHLQATFTAYRGIPVVIMRSDLMSCACRYLHRATETFSCRVFVYLCHWIASANCFQRNQDGSWRAHSISPRPATRSFEQDISTIVERTSIKLQELLNVGDYHVDPGDCDTRNGNSYV